MVFAISFWHPMASIVTTAPVTSRRRSSAGMAVISFDFSSTFSCPNTRRFALAQARTIWMAAVAVALSKEWRSVFPTLCSTHHRTHRNDEDIHQEMTAIGGKGTAGVRQRGKMLMKRRGHAHTHEEAFSQCQGLQMIKLPDHCSGKLSQLLNALALGSEGHGLASCAVAMLQPRAVKCTRAKQ